MGEVVGGRFELELYAGSGGMATVFRARDRLSGARVALKIVGNASANERFEREVALLERLGDERIVRHVAHGHTDDGRMYLAMEWLEGPTLAEVLDRGPLSIEDSLAIARRLAHALMTAHGAGIIHRDVKPSNVLLVGGRPEAATLIDFGIARTESLAVALTTTGMVVGTPTYMAPEQARGERSIDARVDVFALGCVLYECLTGAVTFGGEHVVAVLAKVLLEPAPRVRSLRPEVSRALDWLVASMLEKEPERRPTDIVRALDAVAHDTGNVRTTSPALGATERRLVTVLLAQVVDSRATPDMPFESTAVSGDPRSVRDLTAAAARHGIALHPVACGSLVGSTLGEHVGPDGTLRLALCALEMSAIDPWSTIAIATGRAVAAGKVPVGEAIDRAAALLARHDRKGGVWIDDATTALVDGRPGFRRLASGALVRAPRVDDPAPRVMGQVVPFVGREPEMALLEATYRECADEPVAAATVVTAPPGVGKSRLRREIVDRLLASEPRPAVWIGHADPLTTGSPLMLLASVVCSGLGLVTGEPCASAQTRILAATPDPGVAHFLGEVAGFPFDDGDHPALRAARANPHLHADRVLDAFVAFALAELAKGPLLLVLEDLHWADVASVRVIDELLARAQDQPLMILALARPSLGEAHPKLWTQRRCQRVPLGPLLKKPAERLARALLGDHPQVAAIVNRAEGNALFVEELVRVCAAGGDLSALSPTLAALTDARLLAVDADARQVLRAAAIFGERFPRGGLLHLVEHGVRDGLDELLAGLEARELIGAAVGSRFAGDRELVFRHAVVRDAAYAMLTDEDRALGHRLAAEWLDGRIDEPAVLAHHYELGGIPERAAEQHARAAEKAVYAGDHAAMREHTTRGEACGATGHLLGRLVLARADSAVWERVADAADLGLRAMGLLDRGSPAWFAATGLTAAALGRTGRLDVVLDVVAALEATPAASAAEGRRRAIARARAASQLLYAGEVVRGRALLAGAASEPGAAGDAAVEGWLTDAEFDLSFVTGHVPHPSVALRAKALYESIGDLRGARDQMGNLGLTFAVIGAHAEAITAADAAAPPSQQSGFLLYGRRLNVALLAAKQGDFGTFLAMAGDVRVPRAEAGHRLWIAMLMWKSDPEGAREQLDLARPIAAPHPAFRGLSLAMDARIALAQGRVDAALSLSGEAASTAEQGILAIGAPLQTIARVEALAAAGRQEDARVALAAGTIAMQSCAAELREWGPTYLEQGPSCAELAALVLP